MSKYNVSTLAKKLSEKSKLNQTEAELFIRKMFDVANQGLETDKQLKMRWLGSFKVTAVKDRESVDVNTGERIVIEGRDKISFTPDNILKEIVNKPFAQFETVVVEDGVEFDDIDRKFDMMPNDEENEETEGADVSADLSGAGFDKAESSEAGLAKTESSEAELAKAESNDVDLPKTVDTKQDSPGGSSGVIDFLDTPSTEMTSDQVVVIGQDATIENETKPADEQIVLCQQAQTEESLNQASESHSSDTQDQTSDTQDQTSDTQYQSLDIQSHSSDAQLQTSLSDANARLKALENRNEALEEEEQELRRGHFVLPKYLVIVAILVFVVMIGGFGWFAFNYRKMAAQRDHLAMQLNHYQTKKPKTKVISPKPKTLDADAQEELLREKAREDSIRMVQASEAVKAAENAEKTKDEKANLEKQKTENLKAENLKAEKALEEKTKAEKAKAEKADKAKADKAKQDKLDAQKSKANAKYENDARVRTGAYRIVGVAQVVKVGEGQTLAGISSRYLGPGMECYVEALNGTSSVKAGQSIKIPKLELKKKK